MVWVEVDGIVPAANGVACAVVGECDGVVFSGDACTRKQAREGALGDVPGVC